MTAAEHILSKRLVASGLPASGWDVVSAGLKTRAFWSAKIQDVRHLQAAQSLLGDFLSHARDADGALTSRARLVSDLMRSARERGLYTGTGGISDPGSARRNALIVDTNAGLAAGYANFAAGASTGARLAYPCQELVRVEERRQKRDWRSRWTAAGGKLYAGRMVALKDDPVCSRVSRFGVPYGPPDYGSGMGWRDVSYEDAVALGLIEDGYMPPETPLKDFNAGLEADLQFTGEDDPQWLYLKDAFGDQVRREAGKIRWQADIIADAFRARSADPQYQRALRLGAPTPKALAAAPADARLEGKGLTLQTDHLQHEMDRHIGTAETHADNLPLAESDMAMIPHAWRFPDRVTRGKGDALFFDLQGADGGWYRLVVDAFDKESRFRTFYKVKAGASGLPVKG